MTYGKAIRALRRFTQGSLNRRPQWREPRPDPTTPVVPK
jgi:hypothetical protein